MKEILSKEQVAEMLDEQQCETGCEMCVSFSALAHSHELQRAEIEQLNSHIQQIAASHQSNTESLLEVARERDAVTAELATPLTNEFISRLKNRICDIVQGELCEWGTTATVTLSDGTKKSLRKMMNEEASACIDRLYALVDSFCGSHSATKDEFGRSMVWIAAEIPALDGEEKFWDERDAVMLKELARVTKELERAKGQIVQGKKLYDLTLSNELRWMRKHEEVEQQNSTFKAENAELRADWDRLDFIINQSNNADHPWLDESVWDDLPGDSHDVLREVRAAIDAAREGQKSADEEHGGAK